jgi:hypothetical protein
VKKQETECNAELGQALPALRKAEKDVNALE